MSLTRHFCCCLPVRLGVFVLSLLSLIGGGIYAGATWYAYYHSEDRVYRVWSGVLDPGYRALLGLIGAIGRKRGLVATYSTFMWFHLAAQVAVGAFFIYALFQNNNELVDRINNAANSTNTNANINADDACQLFTKWGRVGAIISLVVILLIELYCCFIVSRYVSQLTDEQSFRAVNRTAHVEANAGRSSGYYPHEPIHSGTELLNKEGHSNDYPYAQAQHSFGHKA
ncbi:hypothetical protein RHS01_06824 [Rhizoctonia solani]|uniref:Uncharacterized protein n=1 Tax=Rhizoctonia solani TaxID=456999 RepID=A0A8H7IB02_9AGAM|nr:hypothetical protein RHS01_06824 [Rhizoctonia solani]